MTDRAARPQVHVVIVTFNSANDIGQCLRAIESTTDTACTITVVDNGSIDSTLDILASDHPEAVVLRNERNVGFAAAVNRGASGATAPWLLLMNPDLIVHPGCIDRLLASAEERPDSGLYTGQTFDPEGHSDTMSIWGFPTLWSATCFALGLDHFLSKSRVFNPESLGPERNLPGDVPAISGALCLIRTDLWEQLGGYDERYILYGEDLDLSFRAKRLGAQPRYEPVASATHQRGASSSSAAIRRALVLLGKATFIRRNYPVALARAQIALLSTGVVLRAMTDRAKGATVESSQWMLSCKQREIWQRGWASHNQAAKDLDTTVKELDDRLRSSAQRTSSSGWANRR